MGSWAQRLRESGSVRAALNATYGIAIILAGAFLFQIDISQPRGVLDGVGYAALLLLTGRFGKRALFTAALISSALTVIAAILVPDEGVSVMAMWANRLFALLSIWAVALVMGQRIDLLMAMRQREVDLRRHKSALERMVRQSLLTDLSLDDRLQFICRTGAEALDCGFAIIALRDEPGKNLKVLQSWRAPPLPNAMPPGTVIKEDPAHKARLRANLTLAIDDLELDDAIGEKRRIGRSHGLRSTLAAEIIQGSTGTGIILLGRGQPHRWNEEDANFVGAIGNLIALLLASHRNAEILAALELTGDGIFTEDRNGNVQYANRAARALADGGKDGPAYPQPRKPLLGDHDQSDIQVGGRQLEVHRTRLPGGGIITRLADVTERSRAQAAQARLEERLQQAAKMEAIGQLAGGVAHDFNNVLGAITGFASFIAQDAGEDSQNRHFAERILAASRRGTEMVERIMAFGETKSVALGVANLGRIIRECHDLLAQSMPPDVTLEATCENRPLLVRGNEVQIGELVANLITNSRDALGSGRGWVKVHAGHASPQDIQAILHRGAQAGERLFGEPLADCSYARLTVSDNGMGIPAEIMDRIFEPFFSTKGRSRGTGLGLAVVHGVIRSHAGFCLLRSAVGEGTEFAVYLPLLKKEAAIDATASVKPCRVLIVDDEVDMADMLSIALERLGFETVTAQNPLMALAAIEEDPAAFDALLSDQIMPDMLGTELIRRAREVAPGLRTVLCTAYGEYANQSHDLGRFVDSVLPKPVEIRALAQALGHPQQD